MSVTSTPAFGELVRDLRKQRGLTQQQLVDAIERRDGVTYTAAAVSEWERGNSRPDGRNAAIVLDAALDADGRILEALGFRPAEPKLDEWRAEVDRRLDAITRSLDDLVKQLGARRGRR